MSRVDFAREFSVVDGEVMPSAEAVLPATDEGFLRGDGVFEVLRAYRGRPFGLEEHVQRLLNSAEGIMLPEVDPLAIERDVAALVEARGSDDDYGIRIIVTRGGHRLAMSESVAVFAPSVSVGFVEYQPTLVLDGFKTLSYAANMLANRLAQKRGFDESLLVTPDGVVLESPTASVFWSPDGERLVTPPLDEGILASITRKTLLGAIDVEVRQTMREELFAASEVFLCSSVREVQAVSAVEDHEMPAPGPLTERAKQAFTAAVEARLAGAPAK